MRYYSQLFVLHNSVDENVCCLIDNFRYCLCYTQLALHSQKYCTVQSGVSITKNSLFQLQVLFFPIKRRRMRLPQKSARRVAPFYDDNVPMIALTRKQVCSDTHFPCLLQTKNARNKEIANKSSSIGGLAMLKPALYVYKLSQFSSFVIAETFLYRQLTWRVDFSRS